MSTTVLSLLFSENYSTYFIVQIDTMDFTLYGLSVNVCSYKQALAVVLDLVHPQCDAAYMHGNLGLMLKIYIFFHHKWTKIFRKTTKFHIWAHWWNLPLFKLYVLLTEHPPPALTGAVRQVSRTQNSPSEGRSRWPLTKQFAPQLAPSLTWAGNSFINVKWRKGKKLPLNVHNL